jgi:hypothetical protein
MCLSQRGYQVSGHKIALLVSTALVSIWSWSFHTFAEAFFVMHFWYDGFIGSVRKKQVPA